MTMTGQPLLEVRDLGKRFAARGGRESSPWVIQDLSFSVADGEFLTIIGPSGAGKTTLLNMIAQIDTASGGEVRFQSEVAPLGDPKALNPGLSCRIGYVTQEDNLLPWRTTLENVLFPLNVQRRLNAETRARADMLIRTVGLAGFENHYPHELSGGMRKRASLIRTLAYDPPVILMDEPFGALDAQTRLHLQEDLLRLWNLGRKTIVFVTHDIAEAIALGDRTLVLSRVAVPDRRRARHHHPAPARHSRHHVASGIRRDSTSASGRRCNDGSRQRARSPARRARQVAAARRHGRPPCARGRARCSPGRSAPTWRGRSTSPIRSRCSQRIVADTQSGELLRHTYVTLRLSAIGFAIGCAFGVALPFLLRRMPRLTNAVEPYIMASVGIPKYALVPLFILWFGIDDAPKLWLVGLLVFYPVFIAVFAGIRNVDRPAHQHGARRRRERGDDRARGDLELAAAVLLRRPENRAAARGQRRDHRRVPGGQ